jgi:hypothetical protein
MEGRVEEFQVEEFLCETWITYDSRHGGGATQQTRCLVGNQDFAFICISDFFFFSVWFENKRDVSLVIFRRSA